MSEKITLKLPKALLEKVLEKAQKQFPLKEIKYFSDATLEALYLFVNDSPGVEGQKTEQKAEATQ